MSLPTGKTASPRMRFFTNYLVSSEHFLCCTLHCILISLLLFTFFFSFVYLFGFPWKRQALSLLSLSNIFCVLVFSTSSWCVFSRNNLDAQLRQFYWVPWMCNVFTTVLNFQLLLLGISFLLLLFFSQCGCWYT